MYFRLLGRESLTIMLRYLKRLKFSTFGLCMQAHPTYGGLGMSAPSLHREFTDSLIYLRSTFLIACTNLSEFSVNTRNH